MGGVKHTPWTAHKLDEMYFDDWTIMRQDGLAVAAIVHNGDITPEETASHARLIAAAPEMKEALETVLAALDASRNDGPFPDFATWELAARAALVKANGEAPQ